MTRISALLTMVAVLGVMAVPARAHDQYHIVGVITKRQPMTIVVKPKGPIVSTVGLDQHTVVVRNDKQVNVSDLKVGLTVVVDALGDTPEDMVAVFIRIVPPIRDGREWTCGRGTERSSRSRSTGQPMSCVTAGRWTFRS